MDNITKSLTLLILLLSSLGVAGCEKLQLGYYLTPENYPTPLPTRTLALAPATPTQPTATPVSTVRIIPTDTLTPLPSPTVPPTPTATMIPCTEIEGRIVLDSFISQITGREFHYRIYLPPCYTYTGRRYPYIIMLHGLVPGTDLMNDSQWDDLGLDEAANQGYVQGELPPMILVMPNGNDAGDYGYDQADLPEVIVNELIPLVESRFCTWNDPARRAIGGLSRGAYWAYWIVFSHPNLFTRVGGHSPFFYEPEFDSDKNPNNLVDTAPGIEQLTMYFDHGAQDYVGDSVRAFVARLRRRGIEPEYVVNSTGAHEVEYWAAHTTDYLLYYAAEWPREVQDFPVCQEPGSTDGGN